MPYNGSGTFNRIYSWVVDAANSVNISSSRMDGEFNGIAAALSNCITRDGQSPPSANLPMGGLKITNLGLATTTTDALSQAAGDARYLTQAGGQTIAGTLTVTGAFTTTPLATFGNGISASAGNITAAAGSLFVNANAQGVYFKDANGSTPNFVCQGDNNFVFYGTDASGAARSIWSVGMRSSSTVVTFAATPTAPTAAAGDSTTKLATTAFVDALRDVPSNYYTASQTVGSAHRGSGADFNGTSLTATIAAGLSNGFACVISNLNASPLSIVSASDTMYLGGTTSTGTRTLAQNGVATVRRVNGVLIISGSGLS